MDIFNSIVLENLREGHFEHLSVTNMREMKMIIETRPSYPSDKLTFNIADFTKDKVIQFFNIDLNLNEQYDVDAVLEDSKRNFMNSF